MGYPSDGGDAAQEMPSSPLARRNVGQWASKVASPSQRRDMQRLLGSLEGHQAQRQAQQLQAVANGDSSFMAPRIDTALGDQPGTAALGLSVSNVPIAGTGSGAPQLSPTHLQTSLDNSQALDHTVRAQLDFSAGTIADQQGKDAGSYVQLAAGLPPPSPSFRELFSQQLHGTTNGGTDADAGADQLRADTLYMPSSSRKLMWR